MLMWLLTVVAASIFDAFNQKNINMKKINFKMKMIARKISFVSLTVIALLASCKKTNDSPGSGDGGGGAHVLQGTIYDPQGNKFNIQNAHVTVHAVGNIGSIGDDNVSYDMEMDGNSHYQANVESGIYVFHATAFMPLNGKTVCIDLAPTDGISPDITQATAPGITKDFKLHLTGLAKWGRADKVEDYFGAHINFADGKYVFGSDGYWHNLATDHPGATIVFHLAIESTLIDGSQGQDQQVQCAVEDLKSGLWFINIPFAKYKVTTTLVEANGAQKPLKLSFISTAATHSNSLELLFPPNPDDDYGHPEEPLMAVWED